MNLSRRDLLASTATASLLPAANLIQSAAKPKRVLRIAHLTDIHVQPSGAAPRGMELALEAVQSLKDKPDVLVTGGDQIMDAMGADKAKTDAQWKLWQDIMKANLELDHIRVIGNHDVWGWGTTISKEEPKYGKAWAQEVLELEKPYYSFNRAGWHFIVLDSTFPRDRGYVAKLDKEQFEWLKGDLAATPKEIPVMVVSHQPLMSASAYLDGDNEKSGNWQVPGAWMHIDFRRIKDAFKTHPNVKLAISGHIHLVDRVDYLGVSYFCNGAASGGWWGGDYQECTNGYALVDLYEDGTFTNTYHPYKWKD